MSERFAMLPEAVFSSNAWNNLPGNPSRVLDILWLHADGKTRRCYPSIATLAKRTGLALATVKRCLNQLEDVGLIRRLQRGGGKADGGKPRATLYEVVIPTGSSVSQLEAATGSSEHGLLAQSDTVNRLNSARSTGSPVSHEQHIEQHKEQHISNSTGNAAAADQDEDVQCEGSEDIARILADAGVSRSRLPKAVQAVVTERYTPEELKTLVADTRKRGANNLAGLLLARIADGDRPDPPVDVLAQIRAFEASEEARQAKQAARQKAERATLEMLTNAGVSNRELRRVLSTVAENKYTPEELRDLIADTQRIAKSNPAGLLADRIRQGQRAGDRPDRVAQLTTKVPRSLAPKRKSEPIDLDADANFILMARENKHDPWLILQKKGRTPEQYKQAFDRAFPRREKRNHGPPKPMDVQILEVLITTHGREAAEAQLTAKGWTPDRIKEAIAASEAWQSTTSPAEPSSEPHDAHDPGDAQQPQAAKEATHGTP